MIRIVGQGIADAWTDEDDRESQRQDTVLHGEGPHERSVRIRLLDEAEAEVRILRLELPEHGLHAEAVLAPLAIEDDDGRILRGDARPRKHGRRHEGDRKKTNTS
jgi:hypothetical protein